MLEFIESAAFEEFLAYYLDDDEYNELQQFMMRHPEESFPASGCVRKLRWRQPGAGKPGGLRVIYYVRHRPNQFWMLPLYAKPKQENIPAHILQKLKEAFDHD